MTKENRTMRLGCIADDLTGATDLALMLARQGMKVVQTMGVAEESLDLSDVDAVVVALKSRTIPRGEAVAQSLAAAEALKAAGAEHLFFKYCSTFDSTDDGNIGPVAEALLRFTGSDFTIACPAFPANHRTVYQGHLFVNGVPLHESSMKDHPLTPMRDSDLVRVLQRQTELPVGRVVFADVDAGPEAIRAAFVREQAAGKRIVIVDAVTDRHLHALGMAAGSLPLITGGSGLAMGLAEAYGMPPRVDDPGPAGSWMNAPEGRNAILAGSCSAATRQQVQAAIDAGCPIFRITADDVADGSVSARIVLDWVAQQRTERPVLIASSADPATVARTQEKFGRIEAGEMIERLLAEIACALPERGFTRMIVAGGETSGAVVGALGVKALEIGPEIDPGVPWTRSIQGTDLALALKSGNFGAPDFFIKAWDLLR